MIFVDFVTILLIIYVIFLAVRPITIFIHELGHAIPALFFTEDNVTIYIGSYGDPDKSKKITMGRLIIYLKYNPFLWKRGLCVQNSKDITINEGILILLSGSIFSFIVALVSLYFIFLYNSHGAVKLVGVVFFASSILDLISNLIPSKTSIKLYDGKSSSVDGKNLKNIFYIKKIIKYTNKAVKLFKREEYKETTKYFEKILSLGYKEENTYRLAIMAYLKTNNYKKAGELLKKLEEEFQFNSDDYCNAGLILTVSDNHNEAIKQYHKSLELNPNNIYALNNRGFTNGIFEKHEEAIKDFDKAIELDPSFANPYDSRGLSRIKIGMVEEGLADIYLSLKLNDKNAYGYRNLGIYHFDKKKYSEALKLFEKAKELDASANKIEYYIKEAKLAIKNSPKSELL